jgi:uncharacterized membrane protein
MIKINKNISNGTAFVVCLFLLSLMTSVNIPPLQSPDEFDHIKRAYLLTKGTIILDAPAGESSGGLIDSGLNVYGDTYFKYRHHANRKISAEVTDHATHIKWAGTMSYSSAPGTGYYFPIVYIPQAIGLAAGEILDLTVDDSYRLARLFTLISVCLLLLAAFKLYAPPVIVMALLIIPMSLFQISTASLDGMATALSILAVSAFIRICIDKEHSARYLLPLLSLVVFVIASCRVNLTPMVLLIFGTYIFTRDKKAFVWGGGITLLLISWTLIALKTTVDLRVVQEVSTSTILSHYLTNPSSLAQVLFNTWSSEMWQSFYFKTFFGALGWLDGWFSDQTYAMLSALILIILAFSISIKATVYNAKITGLLLVTSISSLLLIFLALLVTWTPYPATIISGVQGRYFLIPVILLAYGLGFTASESTTVGWQRACATLVLVFLVLFSSYKTNQLLLSRYYTSSALEEVSINGYMGAADIHFGQLTEGRSFEQEFTAEKGSLYKVSLALATFIRENTGSVTFELLDSSEHALFTYVIDVSEVNDNSWHTIYTGGLNTISDERYLIRLTSTTAKEGNAITWLSTSTDLYNQGKAIVDSRAQKGDFLFQVIYFK